ncbi:MAG: GIY-YIG nuclease family protein [Patescibacteria group bacterium]
MNLLITGGAGFTRPPRQRAKWYYTYVLESAKDGNLYIGWTIDLNARLKEHAKGQVESTKHRRPLKIIYYEACRSKKEAIRREKYFKTGFGRRFLKNRLTGSRGGRVGII